jgi:hypothetical protein
MIREETNYESFTTPGYWLDKSNPYPGAFQPVSWNDNPLVQVLLDDSPCLPPHSYSYAMFDSDHFIDYLQFCPDGGIPVTICSLTWSWSGAATENNGIWSGVASASGPVVNRNDHSFPLWTNVYNGQ